jgi:GPH family glycoside/pentoside/hexuronide:cation symporter
MTQSVLSRWMITQYALMALPLAFVGLPIYIHAPDFYVTTHGQSLAAIGVVLLILRFIDAAQDPFIGVMSDRYAHRRPLIFMIGILLLILGFLMIFMPPDDYIILWFAASIFICTTGFSIVTINLQSVGGVWDIPPDARTRISTWREGMGLIGLLLASVLPTILVTYYSKQISFLIIGCSLIPLFIMSYFLLMRWMQRARFVSSHTDKPTISFMPVLRDKWFQKFIGVYSLSAFASAIPGVLVLFYVRDHLGLESQTGFFLLAYFIAGALAMPAWQFLANRFGKEQSWLYSMLLASVTFIWAFTLEPQSAVAFYMICILSGTALGADLALPPAILADHIQNGDRPVFASRYYSVLAFLSKAMLAVATGIALPLLHFMGYEPGVRDMAGHLPVVYALIPCVIKSVAAFGLYIWLKKQSSP